jgi:hypothetical protein
LPKLHAYLLDRINYLTDTAYAGHFDPSPMHSEARSRRTGSVQDQQLPRVQ